jgi:hypothetical protein
MFVNLKSKIDKEDPPKMEHQCQKTDPLNSEPKFRFAFNWLGEAAHTRINSAVTSSQFETLYRV